MHAVRNIKLCTKDCLCLYVCPTGATDTETGQIDASKCLSGCRLCVDACPSKAISLIPETYPAQQSKDEKVVAILNELAESKVKQEMIADKIAKSTDNPLTKQLANALNMSNQIMAQDILREAGYLLPQSDNVKELLKGWLKEEKSGDFPKEAVERLLELL